MNGDRENHYIFQSTHCLTMMLSILLPLPEIFFSYLYFVESRSLRQQDPEGFSELNITS